MCFLCAIYFVSSHSQILLHTACAATAEERSTPLSNEKRPATSLRDGWMETASRVEASNQHFASAFCAPRCKNSQKFKIHDSNFFPQGGAKKRKPHICEALLYGKIWEPFSGLKRVVASTSSSQLSSSEPSLQLTSPSQILSYEMHSKPLAHVNSLLSHPKQSIVRTQSSTRKIVSCL